MISELNLFDVEGGLDSCGEWEPRCDETLQRLSFRCATEGDFMRRSRSFLLPDSP